LTNSAAVCRGAYTDHKHDQGDDYQCHLHMLRINFLDRVCEGCEFVFHGVYPFLIGLISCPKDTIHQASKQASKNAKNQPAKADFL
jgi:hypothetical protein